MKVSALTGNKLPSIGDVLDLTLHKLGTKEAATVREAVTAVADEVLIFWTKARISTTRRNHITEKLEKLYGEYKLLKKTKNRHSDVQIAREASL